MLEFIIFVLLSFSEGFCVDGSSVSLSRRSIALFMNPAGLAVNPGYEGIYVANEDVHNIGLTIKSFGVGIGKRETGLSFTLVNGFNVSKSLWLGYKHKFGQASKYEVGCMFRPKNLVSLGLVVPLERYPTMRGGIGLSPLTDRVIIFCDAIYKYDSLQALTLKQVQGGIGIEPIDGLTFCFNGNKEGELKFGLEVSFGNLKLLGESNKELKNSTAGVIISREQYPTIVPKRKKVVEITIKGDYPEMSEEEKYLGLFKKREPTFYNLLSNLQRLEDRKDANYLFLHFKPYSMGIAQTEELRQELVRLKKLGKKIITFSESYGLYEYYLASVADCIILTPLGDVALPGIVARRLYLKGTLDKLGIETDIEHIGKYKSARELFEREEMSDEDREQISAFLDDVWEPMLEDIAESRNIDKNELEEFVNKKVFVNSDTALKLGLVHTLGYWYELDDVLKKYIGKSLKRKPLDKFFIEEVPRNLVKEKPKIALLIAEGSIVTGESGYAPFPIIGGKYMGSETVSQLLEKIRKDKSIKALVFRVNSGGGSALASEIIAQALKRVRKEKPVIVSMGNVAGSGGYYISCFGDTIVADKFTLTGSIGVVSAHFILKNLYAKLGISWDIVKRGEHADISELRHFTPEEREKFKQETEWVYDKFLDRVSEGRGLSRAQVDSIGQGRIWSGSSAKRIGLVDEIGGLLKAIDIACKKAKIKDPEIIIFPEPKEKFIIF